MVFNGILPRRNRKNRTEQNRTEQKPAQPQCACTFALTETTMELTAPDDMHLHLRDGAALSALGKGVLLRPCIDQPRSCHSIVTHSLEGIVHIPTSRPHFLHVCCSHTPSTTSTFGHWLTSAFLDLYVISICSMARDRATSHHHAQPEATGDHHGNGEHHCSTLFPNF